MDKRADELLHRLWSKAVGTEGYNKQEWKELAAMIEKEVYGSKELISTAVHEGHVTLCRECYDRAGNLVR